MSSAHLQIKSAPDPPINVKVMSCHGNSANIVWEEGNNNGAEIVGYTLQFNTSDYPDMWYDYDEQFDRNARAATLQLYPWGSYSFRVKSRNSLGSSKPSPATSRTCTTPPDRPDRNPSNVRTRTDKKKTLIIEWTPMSRLYFHGPNFRYQVKWRSKGTFIWGSILVTDPNQGHTEVETNDVYTVYELQLRYWKASEEWKNKKKEVEIILGEDLQSHGPQIKVALSDLPAYTTLRAQVAVMNSHYTGPFSDELDFFTQEGVPSSVRDLRLQARGVAYVLLKWKPPQQPNGLITGYDIAYQPVSGVQLGQARPLLPHINDPSVLGARITGLRPGHRYRFIVWARTKKGRGEFAFIDVMTAKGQPPHPPRVQVSELRNSSVNITWMSDQATRDMKYQVEYRQPGRADWHNTEYVYDKSWLMLDRADVPVSDLEIRLVASNRLGDTATSRTIAVAKIVQQESSHKQKRTPNTNKGSSATSWHWSTSLISPGLGVATSLLLTNLVFRR
ncbi:protein sidekick-2 [Aplysia californica]|uniref:Protein sidekick-2 n=1 Tax=Aplysia californica TaxID=6500 RepID=A0ABM0ZZ47_APLCA|nr:protein sidekick-2 [Aplysia californica]